MQEQKVKEYFSKFRSKDDLIDYLASRADEYSPSESRYYFEEARALPDGPVSFFDVAKSFSKKKNYSRFKNAELYRDILDDLDVQRSMAELSGDRKLANKFDEERYSILESAEAEDVGIYLKKYYPTGYALLANSLASIETKNHVCYNNCIHNMLTSDALPKIVSALETMSQLNPNLSKHVSGTRGSNLAYKIPTIKGMPIGGYGFFSEAIKGVGDFFKNGFSNIKNALAPKSESNAYESNKQLNSDPSSRALNSYENEQKTNSNIGEDLQDFDLFNSDPEKIKSSKLFSSYKGKIVIKNPVETIFGNKYGKTFAFGDFIFLDPENPYLKETPSTEDAKSFMRTLNHEYGHTLQYENLGLANFITQVALPSTFGFLKDNDAKNKAYSDFLKVENDPSISNEEKELNKIEYDRKIEELRKEYFSNPWERSADKMGGVKGRFEKEDDSFVLPSGEFYISSPDPIKNTFRLTKKLINELIRRAYEK